jgi:tetratricopeptide (TPR) repeat protein
MELNDKTKTIIFILFAAILVLSIILPLAAKKFEEQKAALSNDTLKTLWWTGKILHLASLPLWAFLLVLLFYIDWLRSKVNTIELAARFKIVASSILWLTIVLLVLIVIRFILILYYRSDYLVATSIKFLLLSLFLGFSLLFYSWPMAKFCRTQSLSNIVVACLREQHEKFVKANKFDEAYSTLLKACETDPAGIWLWCKLALFCEQKRKNSAEADKYMAKAEELVTTIKANNVSDKACYLDYLGLVNYVRGECDKGLEYIKQAIDIEPKPFRTKTYEGLLLDWKARQQNPNNNIS